MPLPENAALEADPKGYELRKHLLLMATLVVSVTYVAGLNPPGGVWQADEGGHKAGDPILRATHHGRYHAFCYCKATALASSLVITFLLLLEIPRGKYPLAVVRVAMAVDLLGLMGAYIAGSYRGKPADALVVSLCAYVGVQVFPSQYCSSPNSGESGGGVAQPDSGQLLPKERRKVLLLLATFATAVTYVAGLNSPGGYWDHDQGNGVYQRGDPLVEAHHKGHFTMFFYCNTTTFIASLFIVVLLQDEKLSKKTVGERSMALYVFILGAMLVLLGAYVAGSCREAETSVYVVCLVGAVLACIFLVMMMIARRQVSEDGGGGEEATPAAPARRISTTNSSKTDEASKNTKSLILLLATLATTITYQAGLVPPGGVWPDDTQGHTLQHD